MEKSYCQCNCGLEVKLGKTYIHGHQGKGKKRSEETKAKISIAKSGENCSLETRRKISVANSGRVCSEETKAKISIAKSGEIRSLETRRKMSVAKSGENNFNFGKDHSGENNPNFGKHHSEETKAKMSLTRKGENNPNFGKPRSEETKAKISFGNTGKIRSEEHKAKMSFSHREQKCHLWQGGIAYVPYGPGNDKELKEQIRRRDNYTCQEHGEIWVEGEERFAAHHIDYDKNNHIPWNRITLCHICHSKTNLNRDYWTKHFYEINFKNCIRRIIT